MANKHLTAIVIGAGIAGCSTAYALAKRGVAVTLIERHAAIAQEASGNPVAVLYPKLSAEGDMLSTVAQYGFAHTLSVLKQLPADSKMYQLCGQIQLVYNRREKEKQMQLLAKNDRLPSIQSLSAAEASKIANIELTNGGLYIAESGWVKPQLLCQALIASPLIKKHLEIAAIQIRQVEDYWQVLLDNSTPLETNIVVICNANDIRQFTQCSAVPVTPVRGQINFFQANLASRQLRTILCTDHYLSPAIDGYHTIGTSYAPRDMNPTISAADTMTNLKAVKKISSALFSQIEANDMTGRVAWRCATRDYLPLAGQLIDEQLLRKAPPRYNAKPSALPWLKGLYVNAGHGSKGLITAPLCGEMIASLVNGESMTLSPNIVSTLSPNRFMLRSMGLKMLAQNLCNF